jgi:G3E family GTPase
VVTAPIAVTLQVPDPGRYALFSQHHPDEFQLRLEGSGGPLETLETREFAPAHSHEDAVGSVGLRLDGPIDESRFMDWIGRLLRERGADIYRSKGIIQLVGREECLVFQGVHMLMSLDQERPWGDEPRLNQLVFIGRNLDREALMSGFQACLAQ